MLNNLFKEQVSKNSLLSNASNVYKIAKFRKINGVCEVTINNVNNDKYGYIYVVAKNVLDNLSISYDGVVLFETNNDCNKIIPVKYCDNKKIVIDGVCDNLIMYFYGHTFVDDQFNIILAKNKKLVSSGLNKALYSYDDSNDILNNNFEYFDTLENCCFVQDYIISDNLYIGMLTNLNGVYFYTNSDNYTNAKLICESATKSIFVQNCNKKTTTFLYIKNNGLYYKILDENNNLGEEKNIPISSGQVPIDIIAGESTTLNNKCFVVKIDDDHYKLFRIDDNNFISSIGDFHNNIVRFFENDEDIILVEYYNYSVLVTKYIMNVDTNNDIKLSKVSSCRYNNVIDYTIVDNVAFLTSTTGHISQV